MRRQNMIKRTRRRKTHAIRRKTHAIRRKTHAIRRKTLTRRSQRGGVTKEQIFDMVIEDSRKWGLVTTSAYLVHVSDSTLYCLVETY